MYIFFSVNRDKAPGQKECDAAIEKLSNCIRELDRASLSIISQNLTPRVDYSLKVITSN